MLNLIWKDLRIQMRTKTLWIAIAIGLAGAFMLQKNVGYFLWAIMMSTYLFIVYANGYDYKYNGEIIFNSLPISRKEIVAAKYLSALVYLAIPASMTLAISGGLKLLGAPMIERVLDMPTISVVVMLICLYCSVYFPVYFKVGYMGSRWANFISLVILYGFAGVLSGLNSRIQSASSGFLKTVLHALSGTAGLGSALPMFVIAAVLMYVSFMISARVYAKKEL